MLGTVLLWGSSFVGIKYLMGRIDQLTYTWMRSALSILFLSPYIVYRLSMGGIDKRCMYGGLYAGIFYSLGLWLQAWGTRYTSATNSAFITGLNVLFVYVFTGILYRRFTIWHSTSLIIGVSGLYLISMPSPSTGLGDLLVLLGAVMWALQIMVFDGFSKCDPLVLVFWMFIPSITALIPDLLFNGPISIGLDELLVLIYLAVFCNISAFGLQAYGQKRVPPEKTATIFLLEPVFAHMFAALLLGEVLLLVQYAGAGLILLSMIIAIRMVKA